jgi:energy-coupling factor transport system substrate-specific component
MSLATPPSPSGFSSASGLFRRRPAIGLGKRSIVVLALVSLTGLAMFSWPFWISAHPSVSGHDVDAPFLFVLLVPLLVAVAATQLTEGGMDAKALAILGVLSAINAALRPVAGAGTAGIESVFFLLILSGRVFGPGFGFLLGCTSLFASALLTAGIGPWLPFQMLASGWIGLGAGLLPRRARGRREIVMLAAYGVVCAYAFGMLMNLWFWPFVTGIGMPTGHGALAYDPGGPIGENLHRFLIFTLVTSTGGWDTGRAITTCLAIVVVGPAILRVLRRAARKARFEQIEQIEPPTASVTPVASTPATR